MGWDGIYAAKSCLNEMILKINFLVGLELLGIKQDTIPHSKDSDHKFLLCLLHSSCTKHMMPLSPEVDLDLIGVVVLQMA